MENKRYLKWNKKLAAAWKKFPPPARPSKGEINIFQKYLAFQSFNKRKKLRVLILGSTPEFREFCNRNNLEVFCIDINKHNYEALTLLIKIRNRAEKFIQANWIDFKLPLKFDVIMGDNASGMLPLTQYPQFFENISNHLAEDGIFITRPMIQNNDFSVSPKQSIEFYRKYLEKLNINIYTATTNHFLHYYLDTKKSEFSMLFLLEKLKELYKQGIYTKEEFRKLSFYYQANNLTISVPKEKDFLRVFSRFFTIKSKEYSLDYFSSYYTPIYVGVKKS